MGLEGCHRSERPHGLVAAVANNQMLQAFREGGCASVGIFCRLFDIVGLDEGTCGRRLAVSGVLKALDNRLKLSRSHMSFTYPYVMDGLCGFRTARAV